LLGFGAAGELRRSLAIDLSDLISESEGGRGLKIIIVTILAVLLFATSVSTETPSKKAGPTGDVLAAAQAIVNAFGHNDRDAYFALFDPTATFIFYTTPYRLNDRAAYEKEWSKWDKESGFRVRSCSSSDQKVQSFGDTAIFTHSVRSDISTNQGESTLRERETIIFHRINGRWIAVHEHLSPQPNQNTN
jgi:ketosteroid isomerase-like protein